MNEKIAGWEDMGMNDVCPGEKNRNDLPRKEPLSMIVLAGGQSSRMGTDKADMVYRGRTFLNIQIAKGKELGIDDIIVSGYRGSQCDARVVMDSAGGLGPLGGLETCLREADSRKCLVLSVDVPMVSVFELRRLIEYSRTDRHDAVILQHGEKQEPLIGVYCAELADAMREQLDRGKGSVFRFLNSRGYGVYRSTAEEKQFSNINQIEDYRRLTEGMGQMARVCRAQINVKKGEPPVPADSLKMVRGAGVEGDRHTGREDRAVCLCRKEILDWMEQQPVKGLCFARHKENLLIEGLDDGVLVPGARLAGREAVLEISDIPKHCFPEECGLAQAGIPCRLRGEYQMARIERSGVISVGEELELVPQTASCGPCGPR